MISRKPTKHRRTGSSNDLYHLIKSPTNQSQSKLRAVSPPLASCMLPVDRLVRASTKANQQKVVLVEKLEPPPASQFTPMEFGRERPTREARRHKSELHDMQLFSIPEDNSTMDSMQLLLQGGGHLTGKSFRKPHPMMIKEKTVSRMAVQKSEPTLKLAKSPPASQQQKLPRFQQPTQSYNMKKKPAFHNP